MNKAEEAAVRSHERLKVLRHVRKVAAEMDRNPANNWYLWGFGAREIVVALTQLVAEERDRQSGTVPQEDLVSDGNGYWEQLTLDIR